MGSVVVPLWRRERKKLGRPPSILPPEVTLSVEPIEHEDSIARLFLIWQYNEREIRLAMTRDEVEQLVAELNYFKFRRK